MSIPLLSVRLPHSVGVPTELSLFLHRRGPAHASNGADHRLRAALSGANVTAQNNAHLTPCNLPPTIHPDPDLPLPPTAAIAPHLLGYKPNIHTDCRLTVT